MLDYMIICNFSFQLKVVLANSFSVKTIHDSSFGLCCLHRCKRLLVGLIEYMQLQDAMAWLSTLGGAYSAMGEHLYSYVGIYSNSFKYSWPH